MTPVFSKEDFFLCDIPTPPGYPQSQTHCGIAQYEGHYYLTTSPYPLFKSNFIKAHFKSVINKITKGKVFDIKRVESYENPCLYKGDTTSGDPPVQFVPMQDRPLMDAPEEYYGLPSFNSDPDLYIEDGVIYVLNRVVYRTELCPGEPLNKYDISFFVISGLIDNNRFKLERILRLYSSRERQLVSPCLTKYNGKYLLFELETNCYNDSDSFNGLFYRESFTIDGLKDNDVWKEVKVEGYDYLPWHMSVFQYNEHLYSIVACVKRGESQRCWQMLGEFSDDLDNLHIYQTPLTDLKSYRSSAIVNNGLFVLYNCVVQERFRGSKAVDGRDVLLATMPFDDLLLSIREGELNNE